MVHGSTSASHGEMEQQRVLAAAIANADDAALWRWFSSLVEERRLRWCCSAGSWLVSVDHRHVATELAFDLAIRRAKQNSERKGLGGPTPPESHRSRRSSTGNS